MSSSLVLPISVAAFLLSAATGPPLVVAADGVLCDITRTLIGGSARVECLIPPGSDPHTLALRPSDRRVLSQARVVLINGYNPYGSNNLAVWAWMFLFGHLVWATGFMFLISWRGYWQELIETIVWAHQRTPLANLVGWRDKPVALSIVQARVVGLAHFTIGYILTYAAFLIASTSGKFG